jgi:hypothetical protein
MALWKITSIKFEKSNLHAGDYAFATQLQDQDAPERLASIYYVWGDSGPFSLADFFQDCCDATSSEANDWSDEYPCA